MKNKLKTFALATAFVATSIGNINAQEQEKSKEAPIQALSVGVDYIPGFFTNDFAPYVFLGRPEMKNSVLNRAVPKYALFERGLSKKDASFIRIINKTGIEASEDDNFGTKLSKRLMPRDIETDIVMDKKVSGAICPAFDVSINANRFTKGALPSAIRPVFNLGAENSVILEWSPDRALSETVQQSKLSAFVPYNVRAQFAKNTPSSIEARFPTSKLELKRNTTFAKIVNTLIPDETWINASTDGNLNMISTAFNLK